jgi:hypothetical protein
MPQPKQAGILFYCVVNASLKSACIDLPSLCVESSKVLEPLIQNPEP